MDIRDVFKGATFKAADLPEGSRLDCVIESVSLAEYDDGKKLRVSFSNRDQDLICNKTNGEEIARQCGANTDEWRGKTIWLYRAMTQMNGQQTPCVRVVQAEALQAAQPSDVPF